MLVNRFWLVLHQVQKRLSVSVRESSGACRVVDEVAIGSCPTDGFGIRTKANRRRYEVTGTGSASVIDTSGS